VTVVALRTNGANSESEMGVGVLGWFRVFDSSWVSP